MGIECLPVDNAAIGMLTPLLLLLEPTFLAAMILLSGLIAAVMVVSGMK